MNADTVTRHARRVLAQNGALSEKPAPPTLPRYLYHGTSSKFWPAIKRRGLVSGAVAGHNRGERAPLRYVYLTAVDSLSYARHAVHLHGGELCVLRIEVCALDWGCFRAAENYVEMRRLWDDPQLLASYLAAETFTSPQVMRMVRKRICADLWSKVSRDHKWCLESLSECGALCYEGNLPPSCIVSRLTARATFPTFETREDQEGQPPDREFRRWWLSQLFDEKFLREKSDWLGQWDVKLEVRPFPKPDAQTA